MPAKGTFYPGPDSRVPADYYRVLGVAPQAGPDEIKRAFHTAIKTRHSDLPTGSHTEAMMAIEAYRVLSNPALRRAHDVSLADYYPDRAEFSHLRAVFKKKKEVPAPIADFGHSIEDLNVTVDASGTVSSARSRTPLTLSWDWGDGSTTRQSTISETSHSYSRSGRYTIKLIASNSGGSHALARTLDLVGSPRIHDYLIDVYQLTVMVKDLAMRPGVPADVNYLWGDLTSSALPTHTYARSGEYSVTVVASNSEDSDRKSTPVLVNRQPVLTEVTPSITQLNVTDVSVDGELGIGAILQFEWGDGSPPSLIRSHSYAHPGTYTVTVVVENSGGSCSAVSTVRVQQVPHVSDFVIHLRGLAARIADVKVPPLSLPTFMFDWGDGISSTDPCHTYSQPGNYSVRATAVNQEGSSEMTKVITANLRPAITDVVAELVELKVLFLAVEGEVGFDPVFNINWGDGSEGKLLSHTYAVPGHYEIDVSVTNSEGRSRFAIAIEPYILPTIADLAIEQEGVYAYVGQIEVPVGTNPTFTYDWGDGTTSDWSAHCYANRGEYVLTVTALAWGHSHSQTRTITVSKPPENSMSELFGPAYRGQSLGWKGLAQLAIAAQNVGGVRARDLVRAIFDSQLLLACVHLEGCENYAELDSRWKRSFVGLQRLVAESHRLPTSVRLVLTPSVVDMASILHAVVSETYYRDLGRQAQQVDVSGELEFSWFGRLNPFEVGDDELAFYRLRQNCRDLVTLQFDELKHVATTILSPPYEAYSAYQTAVSAEQIALSLIAGDGSYTLSAVIRSVPNPMSSMTAMFDFLNQIPRSVARLKQLVDMLKVSARGLESRIEAVRAHEPQQLPVNRPIPVLESPGRGPRDPRLTSGALAVVAVILGTLDWIWGASHYSETKGPDFLWFLQVLGLLVCGAVAWGATLQVFAGGEHFKERLNEHGLKSAEFEARRRHYIHGLTEHDGLTDDGKLEGIAYAGNNAGDVSQASRIERLEITRRHLDWSYERLAFIRTDPLTDRFLSIWHDVLHVVL